MTLMRKFEMISRPRKPFLITISLTHGCALSLSLSLALSLLITIPPPATQACCAANPNNEFAVNSDQSVLIIWDEEKQTQHFIRKASFHSSSEALGFIIPTPSQPELAESGGAAFDMLQKITTPKPRRSIGCASMVKTVDSAYAADSLITILERKQVAGFDAVVLKAGSSDALITWLEANGYVHSAAVASWAEPYIEKDWPFTALKVSEASKEPAEETATADQAAVKVSASALRLSFKTDTPLFPYREGYDENAIKNLKPTPRNLDIYFIADKPYMGTFDDQREWNATTRWSNKITKHKSDLLKELKLPKDTGPKRWWLTKMRHNWPYAAAASDVYFVKRSQKKVVPSRAGFGIGGMLPLFVLLLLLVPFVFRKRCKRV